MDRARSSTPAREYLTPHIFSTSQESSFTEPRGVPTRLDPRGAPGLSSPYRASPGPQKQSASEMTEEELVPSVTIYQTEKDTPIKVRREIGFPAYGGEPHQGDTWVTVFGFCKPDAQTVLQEFRKCGEITNLKWPQGDSNWIDIQYADKHQAQRALSKNGSRIGMTLMVGVVPCKEPPNRGLQQDIPEPRPFHPPRYAPEYQNPRFSPSQLATYK